MGNFGRKLRDLRIASSLTQDQLADKLNVSKSRISMYETGNREPSFEMLEAIAVFFNVDTSALIGNPSGALSAPEQALLKNFRVLNDAGRAKVVDYVLDLIEMPRYTKYDVADGIG